MIRDKNAKLASPNFLLMLKQEKPHKVFFNKSYNTNESSSAKGEAKDGTRLRQRMRTRQPPILNIVQLNIKRFRQPTMSYKIMNTYI